MKEKIKNLDALRGFLAIVVVIFHIPGMCETVGLPHFSNFPIFQRGSDAVLVFFCLSGFLIIGLLFDEKRKVGVVNIKKFYLRRILRLYPVYYFVLFFGLIYYHYLLPYFNVPFEINYSLLDGIAWNIGFLPNVFKSLYEPGAILEILWSIGIEEQFYLLVAPLLALTPLNKFFRYLLLFTLIYFVIFNMPIFSVFKSFYMVFFYMSAGGALSILMKKGFKVYFSSLYLRIIIYLLFILYFFTDYFMFSNQIIADCFKLILFNLFIINVSNDRFITIQSKFINYIGKISYGIYMYHMIVVNLVLFIFSKLIDKISMSDWSIILLINIACLIGTFIMSHLSFKYYETYFINLKKKFRN
jgi:peptidoglycan/LPS O-acetylase OafA/YrhL